MQDSSTGDGRLVPFSAQSSSRNEIVRIEHAVWTKATPHLAWQVFADWQNWHRISNRYHAIQWHGTPWTPGSRVRVDIFRPFKTTIDRVITLCEPHHCVAWINHVMGYTMEQWVVFQLSYDGTRVSTWLEFTGPGTSIQGRPVQEIIEEYLQEWFEGFREQCDLAASAP